MRLTQQLSAVLCGLALVAFSVTASAQEQTPSPAPSPSPTPAPDLRAKIISAERALAGGASALIGNYFSLGSSTLNSGTTLMGLFKGSKALKKTNSDVDTAIGKGVDEATQKAAVHAVATSLKLEFLYAVAALKQVADELNLIEVAASGKPMDLEPLADRYIAVIELSEEILDIELPRLGVMAALASQATELPEETRAKYKAVGERIAATVEQWRANRTLFARSERNAMDFLAMAPEPVVTGTQISSGRP